MNEPNDLSNPYSFKWLTTDDDAALNFVYTTIDNLGWQRLPDRSTLFTTHRILGAFDRSDRCVAFHVLQFIPHAEPLYVDALHRHSHLGLDLARLMYAYLMAEGCRGWFAVAENSGVAKLCEQFGMKKLEYPVYIG